MNIGLLGISKKNRLRNTAFFLETPNFEVSQHKNEKIRAKSKTELSKILENSPFKILKFF